MSAAATGAEMMGSMLARRGVHLGVCARKWVGVCVCAQVGGRVSG